MIGVPAAVHLNIARIVGKLPFILFAQHKCIPGFWQETIEEFDIAGMEFVIEFVITGVMDNEHATLLEQRLLPIKIEVITEPHHLNQKRVQNGIDVVRRNVRNTRDQNVTLAADRNRILVKAFLNNLFVHRLGLARMAGDHLVLRWHRM